MLQIYVRKYNNTDNVYTLPPPPPVKAYPSYSDKLKLQVLIAGFPAS